jgi:hypothetical protein
VCPEHIKITDNAIIPLKERVVGAKYDPVAWLGRKIANRTKKTPAEAAASSPATGPAAVQPAYAVHGIPTPNGNGTSAHTNGSAPHANGSGPVATEGPTDTPVSEDAPAG